jgi:hypothetical protein
VKKAREPLPLVAALNRRSGDSRVLEGRPAFGADVRSLSDLIRPVSLLTLGSPSPEPAPGRIQTGASQPDQEQDQ